MKRFRSKRIESSPPHDGSGLRRRGNPFPSAPDPAGLSPRDPPPLGSVGATPAARGDTGRAKAATCLGSPGAPIRAAADGLGSLGAKTADSIGLLGMADCLGSLGAAIVLGSVGAR